MFFFRGCSAGLIVLRKNLRAAQIFVRVNVALTSRLLFASSLLPRSFGDVLRILLRVTRLRAQKRCTQEHHATEKNCECEARARSILRAGGHVLAAN